MKNRVWWFLGFYTLLSLFIIYQLVYVIVIWSNNELFDLYYHGFTYSVTSPSTFNPSSYFEMFDLPLIGIILSFAAMVAAVVSQSVILRTTNPNRKGIFLVGSFIIFIIGFYLSFAGQLFYNQWNDSGVTITPKETGSPVPAIDFYKNWFSLTLLWTVFGIFFGLVILSIILIIKLYFLNIQWTRYIKRNEENEDAELELVAPLPSNGQFNPNETQTITISLDKQTIDEGYKSNFKKKTGSFILNNKEIKKKKNEKVKKKFLNKKKK